MGKNEKFDFSLFQLRFQSAGMYAMGTKHQYSYNYCGIYGGVDNMYYWTCGIIAYASDEIPSLDNKDHTCYDKNIYHQMASSNMKR